MSKEIETGSKDDITVYVYEQSIEMDVDRQNSIRKSIENERGKAGIIFGFFFLFLAQIIELMTSLSDFLLGVIFVLITLIFIFLYQSFCSVKMSDGVKTNGNFNANWKAKTKEKFLMDYHRVLEDNIENQKRQLTKISTNIKSAIITLILLSIILLINSNSDMFIFKDDEEKNTMTSEIHEMSEGEDENTMQSDKIEKSS